MKTFTSSLVAITAFFSIAASAPAGGPQSPPGSGCNYPYQTITLHGATPAAEYSLPVPFKTTTYTSAFDPQNLSISKVDYDRVHTKCTFYGVDEKTAAPVDANGQLGPPQTIKSIYCECIV